MALSKLQGIAQTGGLNIVTSGVKSTSKSVITYPACTVTVYLTGTTNIVPIYSDAVGTVKANPFIADSGAAWSFYVADGTYDVRFSGTGITIPFSLGGLVANSFNATNVSLPPSSRVLYADQFAGPDIGAKVNAADATLGANEGEIRLTSGGNIATPIVLSPHHTLRVMGGTYTATTNGVVIWMKDNTSLIGAGWHSILQDSTGTTGGTSPFTVVGAYGSTLSNNGTCQNIVIRNIHFKSARSDFNSAPPMVHLVNAQHVQFTDNWLESARTIGVAVGGGAGSGNHAKDVEISRNLFTDCVSQNLAVVNGEDVRINGNMFVTPGQTSGPGVSVIDLEPNTSADKIRNVLISGNLIDTSLSTNGTVSNGIVVQNGAATTDFEGIVIENNTVIGAKHSTVGTDWILFAGILVRTASHVSVRNNTVQRCVRGIMLDYGSAYCDIVGNTLITCGSGGGTYPIGIDGSSNNLIAYNHAYSPLDDAIGPYSDIYRSMFELSDTGAPDYNRFIGNDAATGATIGAHSTRELVDTWIDFGTLAISGNAISPRNYGNGFYAVGAGLIKNITLPYIFGAGPITIIPTAAFTYDTTGNIGNAGTATIGRPIVFTYSSVALKWYPTNPAVSDYITTGATILTLGTINDGEFLKRSGTTVISSAGNVGVGTGTVTNSGTLTSGGVIIGNGTVDVKADTGLATTGTGATLDLTVGRDIGARKLLLTGTGNVGLTGSTSGVAFIAAQAVAGTGTYQTPNGSGTHVLADVDSAQTLTNKTIAGVNNTLTVRLANDVTGALPLANGGTGQTAATKGDILAANGFGLWNKLAVGTDAQVLTADAASTNGVKWATVSGGGLGDVVGPAASVDSELPLFSSTTGKLLKRSNTVSGLVNLTSGVVSTITAPAGPIVGTTDSQTLTNKTLTTPTIGSFVNATHTHQDAAGGGQLVATSIFSSGTVPTARLGSGTANSGSFLRGDQTWASVTGTGDVVGPSSATDNAVTRFDGTTGKLIQDSVVTIADTTGNISTPGSMTTGAGGGSSGDIALSGSSSGTVHVTVAATAGSHTLKLPTADGSVGQALKTDGSGQWGWVTVGYLEIPQNSKSVAYTTVLADSGKHIYHPGADTTARTWTIDSNANVAYPIGTAITFVNDTSGGVITIAITSDTLVLAGAGTTGSRTLAANGVATAIKMTSTRWIINGTGLT